MVSTFGLNSLKQPNQPDTRFTRSPRALNHVPSESVITSWCSIPGKGDKAELYDIANDPNESKDIATRLPDKLAELKAALEVYAKADKDSVVID